MSRRGRSGLLAVVAAAALAAPAAASAHAYLVATTPTASRVLGAPPAQVSLTYSEPVGPRFAIVSVTDADGRQVTAGAPRRTDNPAQLVIPLRRVPEGWYLVFWRVISADGHPVRGAFTFAVGPNPGPSPEFVIPSLSETATTAQLLVTRWIVFLSLLSALGLFVLRAVIARPVLRLRQDASLRAVSIAFAVALGLALVATPVYVVLATAQFSLRSTFDLGGIIPLARASPFGRDFLDLEVVLALFALTAGTAIALDRPERRQRSVAELLSVTAALATGGAALLVPTLAGHAGQKSPRALGLPLDWLHLACASVWIGGLIGLVVVWLSAGAQGRVETLRVVVPRFSRTAFVAVAALVGSGIGSSFVELPTLASLWQTSYGQALLVKIALVVAAIALAAINLARTRPRLDAAGVRPQLGSGAALLLRRLVQGEIVFVVGALLAASVLTSLAPPSAALAKAGNASARVGPGPVSRVVTKGSYRLHFRISPNRAALSNSFSVGITRGGEPVRNAEVISRFDMLDMSMGEQSYRLPEQRPGVFGRSAPALVMVGHWALEFEIAPPAGRPFTVTLIDRASG